MFIGKEQKLIADFRIGETHAAGIARGFRGDHALRVDFGQRSIRKGEQRSKRFKGDTDQLK
jgi:hypothetical protein